MRRIKRIVIGVLVLVAAAVICLPLGYGAVYMGMLMWKRATAPEIHEVTTPLEPAVVQDLCEKLNLPSDSRLCGPGAVVYAPDFFPAIRARFRVGVTTYDEVESLLGAYCYYREPPVAYRGGAVFSCWYDLSGDHVFPIGLMFTEEGILYRATASTGND